MIKLLIGTLLVLTTANALAGLYITKNAEGQTVLTTVNPSGNFDKSTEKYAGRPYAALYGSPKTSTPNKSFQKIRRPMKKAETINTDIKQSSLSFEVPEGYRLPTKADNTNDWKRFDGPNHLKADFNGDGIEDEAYLLPKKGSNGGFGVFVSINKSKTTIQNVRTFQMFKLIDIDEMSPQSFAIELVEPSEEVWKTACGKGYWKCEAGEPVAVKINIPSIMFCYIESSCNIYMWDGDKLNFKEIVISD